MKIQCNHRIDGDDADECEEHHEIDVGRQVRHELDDGNVVVLVAKWQSEYHPNRWTDYEDDEEEDRAKCVPVQTPTPEFLEVPLDHSVGYHFLLLVLDEDVEKFHVTTVHRGENSTG